MMSNSKQENFEEAKLIRDQIVALEYLLKQPVSPEEYVSNPNLVSDKRLEAISALQNAIMTYTPLQVNELKRIEMYDIANLQGTSATGAMTVAINGEPNSKWYRHFTIKSKSTPDDVSMMMEMLSRRLRRTDWPYPDLIVLDGGKSQLSIVNKLSEEFSTLPPVVSLAKKEETIIIPQLNNEYKELKLPLDHPGLKLIIHLRDEAHRFSRRLHHKHRAKLIS